MLVKKQQMVGGLPKRTVSLMLTLIAVHLATLASCDTCKGRLPFHDNEVVLLATEDGLPLAWHLPVADIDTAMCRKVDVQALKVSFVKLMPLLTIDDDQSAT